MSYKLHTPTLITDITGPDHKDFTPLRAFAVIHQETAAKFTDTRRITRDDVATLALIYASHFSAIHVPFQVNKDAIYSMEGEGYIKATWYSDESVKLQVVEV